MTIIRVICQFCHAPVAEKDGHGVSGTSHGVCLRCAPLSEAEQFAVHAKHPSTPTHIAALSNALWY